MKGEAIYHQILLCPITDHIAYSGLGINVLLYIFYIKGLLCNVSIQNTQKICNFIFFNIMNGILEKQ